MRDPRVYECVSDINTWLNIYYIIPNPKQVGMRVPRVYGGASDMYTWQNYHLNNSLPRVSRGCYFHAYIEARQTFIHGKIIILIITHPK